jgi:predicted nuclease of predicted toxin-antitoxin system
VTADKDFGELVYRQGRAHHGVVLVRLQGMNPEEKGRTVARAIAGRGEELIGAFSVIEADRIRIRRPSPR